MSGIDIVAKQKQKILNEAPIYYQIDNNGLTSEMIKSRVIILAANNMLAKLSDIPAPSNEYTFVEFNGYYANFIQFINSASIKLNTIDDFILSNNGVIAFRYINGIWQEIYRKQGDVSWIDLKLDKTDSLDSDNLSITQTTYSKILIDWGDNTIETITAVTPIPIHTYTDNKIYNVRLYLVSNLFLKIINFGFTTGISYLYISKSFNNIEEILISNNKIISLETHDEWIKLKKIQIFNCPITNIRISSKWVSFVNLNISFCNVVNIDEIIKTINSLQTNNGSFEGALGNNLTPSINVATDISDLISRGWTVNYNTNKFPSNQTIYSNNKAASASNEGKPRYRTDANNSYLEICMKTGASSYAWVEVLSNTW